MNPVRKGLTYVGAGIAGVVILGSAILGINSDLRNDIFNRGNEQRIEKSYQSPSDDGVKIYRSLNQEEMQQRNLQQYMSPNHEIKEAIEGDVALGPENETILQGDNCKYISSAHPGFGCDSEVIVLGNNEVLDRFDLRYVKVGGTMQNGLRLYDIIPGNKPELVVISQESGAATFNSVFVKVINYEDGLTFPVDKKKFYRVTESGNDLNVRDQNRTDSNVLATLEAGDIVELKDTQIYPNFVYQQGADVQGDYQWFRVYVPSRGIEGWVAAVDYTQGGVEYLTFDHEEQRRIPRRNIFSSDHLSGRDIRIEDINGDKLSDVIIPYWKFFDDATIQYMPPTSVEAYSWNGNELASAEVPDDILRSYITNSLINILKWSGQSMDYSLRKMQELYPELYFDSYQQALNIVDLERRVKEVAVSNYTIEEKERRVSEMVQQDPEIGITALYYLNPDIFLDKAKESLGLELTYQFSEMEREILFQTMLSASSGDLFGAGSGLVSALVVNEMAKNTIRSLDGNYSPPSNSSGEVSRPGYYSDRPRCSYVGASCVDDDLFTDFERRNNVVTEERETEIQYQQQQRDTSSIQQSSDPIGSLINTLFDQ